jgi:hypothetical protein
MKGYRKLAKAESHGLGNDKSKPTYTTNNLAGFA